MPALRRVARITGWAALSLVGLVVAAVALVLVWVNTDAGGKKLGSIVEERARAELS